MDLLAAVSPALAERLRAARASRRSAELRMPNQLRQAAGPGWALVGDAGYHRDAVTGYGITDAYRDAELIPAASTRRCAASAADLAGYATGVTPPARNLRPHLRAGRYPPVPEFVALQKRLSVAMETEADVSRLAAPARGRRAPAPSEGRTSCPSTASTPSPCSPRSTR